MRIDTHYWYLAVNIGCIIFPLMLSFERRIRFIGNTKAILTGMALMMSVFIPWDIAFTHFGIWGFNDTYILGKRIIGLPLEELMFFMCIPFACIFTYECVRYFRPKPPSHRFTSFTASALILICAILFFAFLNHWYTALTCALCATLLALHLWRWKSPWLGWILIAWFILLIPFYLSNGILTGLHFWKYPFLNFSPEMIEDQIVWYNNAHNLGLRIWSVPADDFFYGLLMVLLTATGYEAVLKRDHSWGRASVTTTGK